MASNVLKVGNVEITSVLDASAAAAPAMLLPQVTEQQWAPYREHLTADGQLSLSITSFLLRAGGKTILVDTGLGAKDRPFFGNGRLPDALAEIGVRPEDIDLLLVTHIHIDHVGGHTTRRGDTWVPAFPKAKHLFVQPEWDYWTEPKQANAPGNEYVVDCVLPLRDAADIELVANEHRVTDEITMLSTPGHTPGHTSYLISSAGETAVILGDVAHSPVQVTETGWSPPFDVDPVLSARTREAVMGKLVAEKHLLAAGHFPHPGFGRVVQIDGKRYWRGL